jgi:hypothetical protein
LPHYRRQRLLTEHTPASFFAQERSRAALCVSAYLCAALLAGLVIVGVLRMF